MNVLLHSNKRTGHYTVRQDREIVKWLGKKPMHCILKNPYDHMWIVTKGTFAKSRQLGRIVLTPYTGKWPRCALVWAVIKEIVND